MVMDRVEERIAQWSCPGGCGEGLYARESIAVPTAACSKCERRIPHSLLKAVTDPFMYALRLRSGETLEFAEARISGDYAHLIDVKGGAFPFPRGLDVRVDDIVWCADAPEDS